MYTNGFGNGNGVTTTADGFGKGYGDGYARSITYKVATHTEMIVIRPNGDKEMIKTTDPKLANMNDRIFNQIVTGTKKAGRGDVISYKVVMIEKTREMTKNEMVLDEYYRNKDLVKKAMSY